MQTIITPEKITVLPPLVSLSEVSVGDNGGYPRHKFTYAECQLLERNGFLVPERYELIEGDIVPKMPRGNRHKTSITLTVADLLP